MIKGSKARKLGITAGVIIIISVFFNYIWVDVDVDKNVNIDTTIEWDEEPTSEWEGPRVAVGPSGKSMASSSICAIFFPPLLFTRLFYFGIMFLAVGIGLIYYSRSSKKDSYKGVKICAIIFLVLFIMLFVVAFAISGTVEDIDKSTRSEPYSQKYNNYKTHETRTFTGTEHITTTTTTTTHTYIESIGIGILFGILGIIFGMVSGIRGHSTLKELEHEELILQSVYGVAGQQDARFNISQNAPRFNLEPIQLKTIIQKNIREGKLIGWIDDEAWDFVSGPKSQSTQFIQAPQTQFAPQQPQPQLSQPPTAGEGNTQILREYEFYQGFIRMKIGIGNNNPTIITDVVLRLNMDERAILLDHIEPSYKMHKGGIMLGTINPNNKTTIACYLDPLICMATDMDAEVSYKDAQGKRHVETMRPKRIDVVCPIFRADLDNYYLNINTAMLKRMIDTELIFKDVKIFTVPRGVQYFNLFKTAREVVQEHDVHFIRRKIDRQPTFQADAWFFGMTKIKGDKLAICVSVTAESNSIEFFVASTNEKSLCGLLAELGQKLNQKIIEKGFVHTPLQQITNITIKDSVLNRSQISLTGEPSNGGQTTIIQDSVVQRSTIGAPQPTYHQQFQSPQQQQQTTYSPQEPYEYQQPQKNVCSTCGQPLSYIEQNNSYYCYVCQKYK